MKKTRQKTDHLIPEVMQLKAEGKTIMEIGEILGLTKQRISQIARAAQTKAEIQAQWGWPFSTRTFNILDRMAVKDKSEALSLYTSGHLHPNAVTGFGWKSYGEICEWLAVPVLLKRPKQPKLCPHCGKHII
jgi:hypothetical protein